MLDLEAPLGRSSGRAAAAPPAVTLSALASAVPQHVMRQEDVVRRVKALFGDRRLDIDRLLPAFGNAGIETRRSCVPIEWRSEEHTSELQSLMRISYAVFCLKKKKTNTDQLQ